MARPVRTSVAPNPLRPAKSHLIEEYNARTNVVRCDCGWSATPTISPFTVAQWAPPAHPDRPVVRTAALASHSGPFCFAGTLREEGGRPTETHVAATAPEELAEIRRRRHKQKRRQATPGRAMSACS